MDREHRSASAAVKSFSGTGGIEHFIAVTAPADLHDGDQITAVQERYAEVTRSLDLTPETAVFRRLFASDLVNQADGLRAGPLAANRTGGPVAISLVQQPPLPGAKLALLAYHIAGAPITKRRLAPKHLLVRKNGRRHLWSAGLCAGTDDRYIPAAEQTSSVFNDLIGALGEQGATLRNHCVRTWIYVRDIDLCYREMADSRRLLFARQGLGASGHTIASTGIGGACAHRCDLVAMDAYSALDLVPSQISYLNDFARMCSPCDYRVTFERGVCVSYADRRHLFVSGTASVDAAGRALHTGDVLRQFDRALANFEAILKAGSATLADMMYLIVYVRDRADFPRLRDHLYDRLPRLPVITVQARVCRPEWLVEVEGTAIVANDAPALPAF